MSSPNQLPTPSRPPEGVARTDNANRSNSSSPHSPRGLNGTARNEWRAIIAHVQMEQYRNNNHWNIHPPFSVLQAATPDSRGSPPNSLIDHSPVGSPVQNSPENVEPQTRDQEDVPGQGAPIRSADLQSTPPSRPPSFNFSPPRQRQQYTATTRRVNADGAVLGPTQTYNLDLTVYRSGGYPDPPACVLRNQFPATKRPIGDPAARSRHERGGAMTFPPPALSDFPHQVFSNQLSQGGNFDIELFVKNYAAQAEGFEKFLETARQNESGTINQIETKRNILSEFKKQAEDLKQKQDTRDTRDIHRLLYDTRKKIIQLEAEIGDLMENLAERRNEVGGAILNLWQNERLDKRKRRTPAMAELVKKARSDNLPQPMAEESRDVLIPEWFPIFVTYGIMNFTGESLAERFNELLNCINKFEREIQEREERSQRGENLNRKWDREWHDPGPQWQAESAKSRGG